MTRGTISARTVTWAAVVVAPLFGRAAIVSAQLAVQPFYLEQTTSALNSETGIFAPHRTTTLARRVDGVTTVVEGLGPDFSARIRKIMSPNGLAVTLWDNAKLKTTWPESEGPSAG